MLASGTIASTVLFGIIVYVGFVIIRNLVWLFRMKKFFDDLPGYGKEVKHWLRGDLPKLIKDDVVNLEELENLVKKFPKFFRLWFTSFRPSVVLVHPDTVKVLLKTAEPKPMGLTGAYRAVKPWLGEGLLLAGGPKWARSRRLLTPAFHFDILKPYHKIYNQCADVLLDIIDKYAESGESFELFQLISNCTLDIILQCAFSYKTNCQRDRDQHPYCKAISQNAILTGKRLRTPMYILDFMWNLSKPGKEFNENCDFIHKTAEDVITSRRKVLEEENQEKKKHLDFLDILLTAKDDTGVGLTPEEIRAEVDTFMFEGHDTTTSGISWILYELAKNPSYQQQCQKEVDEILKENPSFVKWEDLSRFEFLTQCIKEGMRMHSPVPAISRQSTRKLTVDGVTFPENTLFNIHVYLVHHNPTVWKNPHDFDPSRFSKANSKEMDSFAFIPFAAGPRNCIGQHFAMDEEKTVISRILERFTLELDPKHHIRHQMAMIMRAKNGIKCYAKRR